MAAIALSTAGLGCLVPGALGAVLGGLDESDGRVFRSHLLECADCRARVGELRAIAHELADVERDERRQRAAKAIETKRRETAEDDDEPGDAGRGQRAARILAVVGFALVVVLAAWNFTLRGTVARQEMAIADLQQASEILQLGEAAIVRTLVDGVEAQVKVRDGNLVLLADGLDDDELYGVYGLTADGDVTFSRGWQPTDQKLHVLIRNPGDADQLIVTEYTGQMPPQPDGRRVLTARLPAPD